MPFLKWIGIGLLSCSLSLQVDAANYKTNTDTTQRTGFELVADNPIAAMLDSLANFRFNGLADFPADRKSLNKYNYPEGFVPEFPDTIISERLAHLSRISPFEFKFNAQVKQYIDLYAVRKRGLTQRVLGLAKIYFPLFEEQLDRHNMPLELKYLAVIESALNPAARSRVGAKGLWQFMYGTGIMYDLQVTSYVDDRSDPYKSTVAACEHMNDLYELYHDWSLVLAAYNSGAGNVNRAIRKAGGVMDFWVIQRFLPRETRDYVPAFIAASYVMHYATEYNLYPVYPGITAAEIDSVAVHQFLSFDQISGALNVSLENIRYLNPCYTKDVIPASSEKAYFLRLPRKNIIDFVNNEQAVYAFKTAKSLEREKMMAQVKELKDNSTLHVVRKGETLASIAAKYNCTPADIKKWNRLKKGTVKARQELLVYTRKKTPPAANPAKAEETMLAKNSGSDPNFIGPPVDSANLAKSNPLPVSKSPSVANNEKYIYHTIRQGDTLWEIATRYKVSMDQIKNLNNIKNANSLKPGQKIKVGING